MTNNLMKSGALTGVVLFSMSGCGLLDKLTGVDKSYCESLCVWGVECAEGTSSLSADEMTERCMEATYDEDGKCKQADDGDLTPDENLLTNTCAEAVADMSCNGLTGSAEQTAMGHPPALQCIVGYGGVDSVAEFNMDDPVEALKDISAYKTYNAARNAILVTGDELCDDVSYELCSNLISCAPDFEDDEDYRADAVDACLEVVDAFTSKCKSEELYDQDLPFDINTARYFAKQCVEELESSDSLCSPASWAGLANCAGAFINPLEGTDLTSEALDAFGGVL